MCFLNVISKRLLVNGNRGFVGKLKQFLSTFVKMINISKKKKTKKNVALS